MLCQPLLDTVSAAKLRAGGTEYSVLDLSVADEAFEDLLDVLVCARLLLLSWMAPMAMGRTNVGVDILLDDASSVGALNGTDIGESLIRPGLIDTGHCLIGQVPRVTHGNNVIIVVYLILQWILIHPSSRDSVCVNALVLASSVRSSSKGVDLGNSARWTTDTEGSKVEVGLPHLPLASIDVVFLACVEDVVFFVARASEVPTGYRIRPQAWNSLPVASLHA